MVSFFLVENGKVGIVPSAVECLPMVHLVLLLARRTVVAAQVLWVPEALTDVTTSHEHRIDCNFSSLSFSMYA